ncbi:hypothetical protein BT93_A1892 [Corymbia citriodora subsp. variegata]|nr:hypothetical protein BT93_A1892 [Corymbia citriodora subsp. variegata]
MLLAQCWSLVVIFFVPIFLKILALLYCMYQKPSSVVAAAAAHNENGETIKVVFESLPRAACLPLPLSLSLSLSDTRNKNNIKGSCFHVLKVKLTPPLSSFHDCPRLFAFDCGSVNGRLNSRPERQVQWTKMQKEGTENTRGPVDCHGGSIPLLDRWLESRQKTLKMRTSMVKFQCVEKKDIIDKHSTKSPKGQCDFEEGARHFLETH